MSQTVSIQETVPDSSLNPLQATAEFEVVPESPLAADAAEPASALPTEQAPEVQEVTPAFLADHTAELASALPTEQAPEVQEVTPAFLADHTAELASALPTEEVPEIEEVAASSTTGDTSGQTCLPPFQSSPLLEEAPQRSLGRQAEQESLQPSFLSFYGLREQPFGVTPDPAYLYLGQMHREALRSLSCGIQNDRGFMALIAEPGMGKTTLLNKLIEELRDSARTVFLFQTQCASREFFGYLLSELGVENVVGTDLVSMYNKLNEILFQEMLEGRRFVLIVDEAQNLDDSVLETIRLLSNFETTHAKLLEIVLAGQPQLAAKLSRPSLSQLRQRIAVLTNLEPLSTAETARYIEHRLRVAGHSGELFFAPGAVALITERSQGIPRSINNICFNALMLGYSRGRKTIDSDIVQEVVAKSDLESLVRRTQQPEAAREPAPVVAADNPPQLTCQPLTPLVGQGQPDRSCVEGAKSIARATLSGRVTGLIASGHWGNGREFRIQASLERDPSCMPVANRYYCCSFYVGEKEATAFRAGRPIRITIEQD